MSIVAPAAKVIAITAGAAVTYPSAIREAPLASMPRVRVARRPSVSASRPPVIWENIEPSA